MKVPVIKFRRLYNSCGDIWSHSHCTCAKK